MPGKPKPHELIAFTGSEYLVETIQDTSGLIFAVCDLKGVIKQESGFYINGIEYKPYHHDRMILDRVVLLPPAPISYGSQKALLSELCAFLGRYLDAPDWWIQLSAYYILLTWVYERFNSIPYLRVVGGPGLGKSRFLALVEELSYRGCNISGAMGPAVVYRIIQRYRPTLIVDEMNPIDSSNKSDLVKILNQGYARRSHVVRCSRDNDWQTNPFDPFGPKIVAGHEEFRDASFESRCFKWLPIRHKIRTDIPCQEPPNLREEARELRGKLLQWRFENYRSITIDESGELTRLSDRPRELATAIYSICQDEDFKQSFIDYVSDEKREEDDSSAKNWIIDFIKNTPGDQLLLKTIAEAYNETVDKCDWIWGKQVGRLVRELGIKVQHSNQGKRAIGLHCFRGKPSEVSVGVTQTGD